MKIMKILLFLTPLVLMANQSGENGYDIVPRVLNFLLFAGILYYFIANPIKNAYKARINSIAAKLDSVQQKLKESKLKKDGMLVRVEDAKESAKILIETAKKEAALISEKIKNDTKQDIINLEKNFQDQKEFEQRRIAKSVVAKVIDEIFANDNARVDQGELINIVLKKVG